MRQGQVLYKTGTGAGLGTNVRVAVAAVLVVEESRAPPSHGTGWTLEEGVSRVLGKRPRDGSFSSLLCRKRDSPIVRRGEPKGGVSWGLQCRNATGGAFRCLV